MENLTPLWIYLLQFLLFLGIVYILAEDNHASKIYNFEIH